MITPLRALPLVAGGVLLTTIFVAAQTPSEDKVVPPPYRPGLGDPGTIRCFRHRQVPAIRPRRAETLRPGARRHARSRRKTDPHQSDYQKARTS